MSPDPDLGVGTVEEDPGQQVEEFLPLRPQVGRGRAEEKGGEGDDLQFPLADIDPDEAA